MAWSNYEGNFNTLVTKYTSQNLPFPEGEMQFISSMLRYADARNHLPGHEYLDEVMNGNYSHFERLHPVLRNYFAIQKSEDLLRQMDPIAGLSNFGHPLWTEDEFLQENAMNPAFRLYCSLRSAQFEADRPRPAQAEQAGTSRARAAVETPNPFRAYDDQMNSYLMEQTLSPITADQVQGLKNTGMSDERVRETVGRNVEKQVQMAKVLFLAHFGKAVLREEGATEDRPLDRSVASMMAHCSRTAFVLPPGQFSNEAPNMMDAIMGPNRGRDAGVYRRTASTHSSTNGATFADYKENKGTSLRNQYGMDVAIGGIGRGGIPGRDGQPQTLRDDGTCGHMYMCATQGALGQTSSLLVGFESDSPSASGNQQGHKHTITAAPEYMSSFLGQRTDEMGLKYGGRLVDLTQVRNPEMLTQLVNRFANQYRNLLTAAMQDSNLAQRLQAVNANLCGNPMNAHEMAWTLTGVGFSQEDSISYARESARIRGTAPVIAESALCEPLPQLAQAPPARSKPGIFTRFKAFFGSREAKKTVEEYNTYQTHCQQLVGTLERQDAAAAHQGTPQAASQESRQESRTNSNTAHRELRTFSELQQRPAASDSLESEGQSLSGQPSQSMRSQQPGREQGTLQQGQNQDSLQQEQNQESLQQGQNQESRQHRHHSESHQRRHHSRSQQQEQNQESLQQGQNQESLQQGQNQESLQQGQNQESHQHRRRNRSQQHEQDQGSHRRRRRSPQGNQAENQRTM